MPAVGLHPTPWPTPYGPSTPYCHSDRSEESSAPCPRPRGSEKQTLRVAQGDRANHCGKIISHGGVRIPSPSSLHFRKTCHSRHQSSGIQVFSSSSSGLHFKQFKEAYKNLFDIVLIPSSSGLHFKRDSGIRNLRSGGGLNPFFVRSSFQTGRSPFHGFPG